MYVCNVALSLLSHALSPDAPRYSNTGKTFYIGHWEGDWCIRDAYNKDMTANPKKVQAMVKLLTDKQRAIDAAKKDNPWAKNVSVCYKFEIQGVLHREKRCHAEDLTTITDS
jgi:hypothetical protein